MSPFLVWLLIIFTFCFGLLYVYLTWDYDYWEERSVPHVRAYFPFGFVFSLILSKESILERNRRVYLRFKGQRYFGLIIVKKPALMIRDPGLIKQVLVKDFSHFHDRGLPVDEVNDPLTGNLFSLEGSRWHSLRNKLSPTFSSGKMKYMFPIVRTCAEHLQQVAANEMERLKGAIEMKDLMARYTTDVIASAAFGVEAGSLKNPDSEFRSIGRRIFSSTLLNAFRALMIPFLPSLIFKLGFKSIDPVAEKFFTRIVKETVTYREENDVKRADFLQLLLGLKADSQEDHAEGSPETKLTMNQLTAQCFVFFLGGFETSATTLAFTLYELSKNVDVQRQLRDEVDNVLRKHGGEITYDGLAQMPYMDCVIAETLRKYPPVPVLFRECTKEWTIPSDEETGSDTRKWKRETRNGGHVVEVGTQVNIPIIGLHYDPEYFENPETFDPERFAEGRRKRWPQFAYLPFGEGPRICIGMRFGNMQTKVGLTALLSKFEFRLSPKTLDPIVLDKFNIIPTVKGGLWLELIARTTSPKQEIC